MQDLSVTLQASFMQMANTITTPLMVFPEGVIPGFPDGLRRRPRQMGTPGPFLRLRHLQRLNDHRIRMGMGHDQLEIYRTRESKNFTQIPVLAPRPM